MARGIAGPTSRDDVALDMLAAIGKTDQVILRTDILVPSGLGRPPDHRDFAPVAKATLLTVGDLPKFLAFDPVAFVPDFSMMPAQFPSPFADICAGIVL